MSKMKEILIPELKEYFFEQEGLKFKALWDLFQKRYPLADEITLLCKVMVAMQPGVTQWRYDTKGDM